MTDRQFSAAASAGTAAERSAADLAMQSADAIDGATAAHRQIGHVERFSWIARVLAAQREQLCERDMSSSSAHSSSK